MQGARAAYFTPGQVGQELGDADGIPGQLRVRGPSGWWWSSGPSKVVGAICPPVMP